MLKPCFRLMGRGIQSCQCHRFFIACTKHGYIGWFCWEHPNLSSSYPIQFDFWLKLCWLQPKHISPTHSALSNRFLLIFKSNFARLSSRAHWICSPRPMNSENNREGWFEILLPEGNLIPIAQFGSKYLTRTCLSFSFQGLYTPDPRA